MLLCSPIRTPAFHGLLFSQIITQTYVLVRCFSKNYDTWPKVKIAPNSVQT